MIDQSSIEEMRLISRAFHSRSEWIDGTDQPGLRSVRTDLAVEARDLASERAGREPDGIVSQEKSGEYTKTVTVKVMTPEAERITGKQIGTYVTIECPDIRISTRAAKDETAKTLSSHLATMLQDSRVMPDDEVLVAGLGNWNATPDAIGPAVVGKLLVTRHLGRMLPPEKRGGLRPVSALSPGVLGLTGIETAEIIASVVEKTRPKAVIVIDALAARSTSRIGTSIQIGNTGIHPGSGVGNRRFGITSDSLGVPVIAVGVPTVVDVTTIVMDVFEIMNKTGDSGLVQLPADRMREAVVQMIGPGMSQMVVTPKEIDVIVEMMSTVVAGGLNIALHESLTEDEIYEYLH
ncbi:MAG: GPR endopeptidase [Bacillota bacterium]